MLYNKAIVNCYCYLLKRKQRCSYNIIIEHAVRCEMAYTLGVRW